MHAPATHDTHLTIEPSILYVGTPVALITTRNPDGGTNISPMSSAWMLDDRAVLGLATESMGWENAMRERELVINFPAAALWPKVEALARLTGRDPVSERKARMGYVTARDKFPLAGLTRQPSELVRPHRIAECQIQFEAVVAQSHDPAGTEVGGSGGFQIVEARVLRVHAHPDIVIDGTSHIDTARWSPLLYVFRHYFGTGADLGRTFRAEA